jgi:hypothetical protein
MISLCLTEKEAEQIVDAFYALFHFALEHCQYPDIEDVDLAKRIASEVPGAKPDWSKFIDKGI